jgi:NAD-dependent DNA ligase|tara:strand:+ start:244 stop:567 length:324 start_codon:yes stop_codon:yes gene_type:complete
MENAILGKTIVFAGQTVKPRAELKTIAECRGATVRGKGGKGAFVLVAGSGLPSKLVLARRNPNALILTERQFLRAARGPIRRAIENLLIGATMGAIFGAALFAGFLL